jgi:hypothetical protein
MNDAFKSQDGLQGNPPDARRADRLAWKRALDLSLIILSAPFTIPIAAAIALVIRLVSRGPALFRQKRVGLHGQTFMCLKFRTMKVNADPGVHRNYLNELIGSDAPMKKMDVKGDSRLIPFGAILLNGHLSGAAVDVFPVEPEKNGDPFSSPLQGLSNVLLTPHVGGSTQEAQYNIGEDVSNKLFNYLEKGISTGSHSIPELSLPPQEGTHRILHIHHNVPGVLSEINTQMSKHKINILGQYLKTNDTIGYVVLDVNKNLSKNALELLRKVKATIKARMLY